MTKIVNINTGDIKKRPTIPTFNCSICDCRFTEDEGGLQQGAIGMIPVSFCPTCFSGIFDMVDYFTDEERSDE